MILAFDHISAGVVPETFRDYIVKYLVRPIALGELQRIRVILVVTDGRDNLQQLGLNDLPGLKDVQLQRFRQAEFDRLILDYCRQADLSEDLAKWYVEKLSPEIKAPWPPDWFPFIRDMIQRDPRNR
jgi:hypothetical protein